MKKPIAIVGGGITGLTAAFRLLERGLPVTIFEAGPRAGGVIRTVEEKGFLAETGPNTILATAPEIGGMVSALGLDSRKLDPFEQAKKRYVVRRRKPVALPMSAGAFLRTPLFSASAKLRLLAEPFIAKAPPDREESLADFVERRLGPEILDYAINPFVAGVYAGDPARLSVQHAFPKLYALEQKYGSLIKGQIKGAKERKQRKEVSKKDASMFSFDHGLQVLTDTLARKMGANLRLNTPVKRLRRGDAGWMVKSMDGSEQEFGQVLLTGAAHRLGEIGLETSDHLSLAPLERVTLPPVASLVLGFRREDVRHPLDGFGMLIPQREGFHILGTLFSSSLFPNRAPEGHVTVTSYIGGTRAPQLAGLDLERLIEVTLEDLRELLGVAGYPVWTHHSYFAEAIPQYEVGYGELKRWMDEIEQRAPGLYLAGNYRDGISVADSIVAGHRAAERLAKAAETREAAGALVGEG